jgi:hypothetical protein
MLGSFSVFPDTMRCGFGVGVVSLLLDALVVTGLWLHISDV